VIPLLDIPRGIVQRLDPEGEGSTRSTPSRSAQPRTSSGRTAWPRLPTAVITMPTSRSFTPRLQRYRSEGIAGRRTFLRLRLDGPIQSKHVTAGSLQMKLGSSDLWSIAHFSQVAKALDRVVATLARPMAPWSWAAHDQTVGDSEIELGHGIPTCQVRHDQSERKS